MTPVLNNFCNYCAVYFLFFVCESIFRSPKPIHLVPHWWLRLGLLFTLRTLVASLLTLALFKMFGPIVTPHPLWASVPAPITSLVAILLFTLFHYWSHRLRHHVDFFWQTQHQMHHSPKRFDLSLTLYVHPLDVAHLIFLLYFFAIAFGLGLKEFVMLAAFEQIVGKSQHLNVRTPYWIGYLIFRPEQHRLHHETHDVNYGLISLWDIVFGTFKNCRAEVSEIGFSEAAQTKFWDIFFFKKVS